MVRTIVVLVVVAGIAVAGTLLITRARGTTADPGTVATGTARIVRTDLSISTPVNGTLGYAHSYAVVNGDDGVYTLLPTTGQTYLRGQSLYEVDGRPIVLLYGDRPAWRQLSLGVPDGEDVGELKQNLRTLGFAHAVDNHFDLATESAVRRWQTSLGVPVTGVVGVGDAVFVPGPLRVTQVQADPGSPARAGSTLLHGTGTDRVVNLSLPVAQEYLVKVGNAVTVTMPDGRTTTPGTVSAVSTVATSNDGIGSVQPSASNGGPLFVNVTVTLTDPAATGNIDQAPVSVNITDQSVHDVLAVPINALVALAEGGYAVEIVDHATHRLSAVHTGLFSDSLVEVSGQGIAAGETVEVPAS